MKLAAAAEYMHMASLVHDDIIDESDLRRGMPTLHETTGIEAAVHIGNYMMSRALEWAASGAEAHEGREASASEEEQERAAELTSIISELCLGEYQQLANRFNFDLTLEQYLDKTRRKTALLMAACLSAGAKAAEASDHVVRLLYEFGEAVGMAFQIRDDVLDFRQPREVIGKPAGADLRKGNITLPVLLAMEDRETNALIRRLHADSSEEEMSEAIQRIMDSDAPERSLAFSRTYAVKAQEAIEQLSDYPAYRDLLVLKDYFLK